MPHEQPAWQDITVEVIHSLIANNDLEKARSAILIRKQALEEACVDTTDAIEKDEGEVSPAQWLKETESIQEEILELQGLLQSIDTDTQNE